MYSVVIADDDFAICKGLQKILETSLDNIKIENVFYDGNDFYEYLCAHSPDIVISDISMSGKNGIEICKYVNSNMPDTHIILITGHLEFEYAKEAVNNHADYFLPKPFSSKQIIGCVRSITEKLDNRAKLGIESSKKYLQNWNALRSSVHDAMHGKVSAQLIIDLFENISAKNLRNYNLCQIAFSSSEVSRRNVEKIKQYAADLGDIETSDLCMIFADIINDNIIFLVIYKTADIALLISDFIKSMRFATDIELEASYINFTTIEDWIDYCKNLTICEKLLELINNSSIDYASAYLKTEINGYSAERLRALYPFIVGYLKRNSAFSVQQTEAENLPDNIKELEHLIYSIPYCIFNAESNSVLISKATDYIRHNYDDSNLSLSGVAQFLDISSGHLGKLFKSKTHKNFSDFVLEMRMEQAKQLLITTDKTILEISRLVGYTYPTYFRKMFNSYEKMSPSRYRELNK